MKGKWAEGIRPRNFAWVIKNHLAVSERPGGYGSSHRRVRRQEEIIWIRQQEFDCVISLIGAPHNLHNYDELGLRALHRPFPVGPANDETLVTLDRLYSEIRELTRRNLKVLVHHEEVNDRVLGLMAGYLVWTAMVPDQPRAVVMTERIFGRKIGSMGRSIVAAADRAADMHRAG